MILSDFSDAFLSKSSKQLWLRSDKLDLCKCLLNLKHDPGTFDYYLEIAEYYGERLGLTAAYNKKASSYKDWVNKHLLKENHEELQRLESLYLEEVVHMKLLDFKADLQKLSKYGYSVNSFGFIEIDGTVLKKVFEFWKNPDAIWYHGEYFMLEHIYEQEKKAIVSKHGKRSKKPKTVKYKNKPQQKTWIDEMLLED